MKIFHGRERFSWTQSSMPIKNVFFLLFFLRKSVLWSKTVHYVQSNLNRTPLIHQNHPSSYQKLPERDCCWSVTSQRTAALQCVSDFRKALEDATAHQHVNITIGIH